MGLLIVCNLLLPALLIIVGALMARFPPKKINALYGYRTERSMQSADTWVFANVYSGKLIWRTGWVALAAAALVSLLFRRFGEGAMTIVNLLLMAAQCVALIVIIPMTEQALKATFDDEGVRKQQP